MTNMIEERRESMTADITLKLYGSLQTAFPRLQDGTLRPRAEAGQPLEAFLAALGIDIDDIQLVMRNHRAVGFDTPIRPGDRLALFPREYPVFVDWLTFRHRRPPDSEARRHPDPSPQKGPAEGRSP
jgi:hypothetical protein